MFIIFVLTGMLQLQVKLGAAANHLSVPIQVPKYPSFLLLVIYSEPNLSFLKTTNAY